MARRYNRRVLVHEKFFQEFDTEVGWWQGKCHDLSHEVSCYLKEKGVGHRLVWVKRVATDGDGYLYPVKTPEVEHGQQWRFHVAVEIDGKIHDPWLPGKKLPLSRYLAALFPGQLTKVYRGRFSSDRLAEMSATVPFVNDGVVGV